jgi:hypothetical protein
MAASILLALSSASESIFVARAWASETIRLACSSAFRRCSST